MFNQPQQFSGNFSTPEQLIQAAKASGNPELFVMQLLQSRMQGTPLGDNLIQMAKQGQGAGIEQFARNYLKQSGIDFDKAFNAFRKTWGL